MQSLSELLCLKSEYWTLASIALTIFATVISIGYLLKPKLFYAVYQRTKDNKKKWVVEVTNKNLLPFTIKEVKCEIAVSKEIDFKTAKSLKLLKEDTLILKRKSKTLQNNYIFVPEKETNSFDGYIYIRARILATNLIGVKKHYERICKIECLNTDECRRLIGNPEHKRLTKKLIKEELINMQNHV